jgi:hypothetical protein
MKILTVSTRNGFVYNKIHTEPVETLEINHYSGFKAFNVNFGVKKYIRVELDVEVLMNLMSSSPFHNVITIKSIPLDLKVDPPKPLGGVILASMQFVVSYFTPFRRPLNLTHP